MGPNARFLGQLSFAIFSGPEHQDMVGWAPRRGVFAAQVSWCSGQSCLASVTIHSRLLDQNIWRRDPSTHGQLCLCHLGWACDPGYLAQNSPFFLGGNTFAICISGLFIASAVCQRLLSLEQLNVLLVMDVETVSLFKFLRPK